ncbi:MULTISPECIES: Lar family restriction alleviation protein [unclassified Gilliamella]|uniref:Lar family restriction alleviation protein n=1 Tax=unclassified Gilliamella TaxID=2685620 RepID=UPI002269A61D|nr:MULTISPECIES: Lar family restriction alleviation protein [unclassified Gilliamella]MCX8602427.1 Lar family restriction alleviation protein [Gilliamella sp. B3722]MCX8607763.1 Lar family restriction alleviation protein [Gilliamella sp. B3771]MCX8611586.1 Lar family restriction alleviation protein [Gilliamella sp. B3891]MCX8614146.1 Lar family restriction alleviation protein [Gilliamella sp. B3773]MCX8621414.1 Lar family restriction alleviation protein [Gilliamella sp. B3892]
MTKQLKPCTFCGSKDLSVKYIDYNCYAVECNNCGAMGRFRETKNDAQSAWNSRIDESTNYTKE